MHPSLTGKTVALACELKDENAVVREKTDYLFLEDYGVAVIAETSSSRIKSTYKVVDVKFTM